MVRPFGFLVVRFGLHIHIITKEVTMEDLVDVQGRRGTTGLEGWSTEELIGAACLYKSRCEGSYRGHFHDREPGQSMLAVVSFGYATIGELIKRMSEEDWDWYFNLFKEIGAVK